MAAVSIRPAESHADLHACIDLQRAVWGLDDLNLVPFHHLHTAHEWGGRVLVAEDQGRIVGFCYGFGGRQYGRPALLSHMLAVLPEYRGQGLGAELKLAQGRWARSEGYELITWTYDPLEAVNAGLNIARLGGIVRRYLVNHYGEMTDGLNRGLPSDRLLLEWHLRSPRVEAILDGAAPPPLPAPALRCEVPFGFQRIKRQDPPGAMAWRMRVRETLTRALAEGYIITSFEQSDEAGFYGLSREEEPLDAD
ncbi:MAG: GNAT family N-acetyltransferase [Bacillota bacterium]